MTVRIEHAIMEDYKDEWNNFVKSYPLSTAYHLWEFGEALSLTYGYKRYYLIAKSNDKTVGIFPLIYIKSRIFGSKLLSLPFCEYGGPLTDENSSRSKEIMFSYLKEMLNLKSSLKSLSYVEVRNPNLPTEAFKAMVQFGFKPIKNYVTFRIDLTKNVDALWRTLDKKTRNAVRKAMKSNLTVYEANTDNDLWKYYCLYLKTQKRHGSPPHSFELFKNLAKFMKKNAKMLIAEYDSIPSAGIIAFYNKRTIYWWNAVSDDKFRSLNSTNLLLWELIQWGCEKGYVCLDLGRTRLGSGVYHFKKGWGGAEIRLKDYVYPIKHGDKGTPDPSESIFRLLSRIWAKMPIFMARRFGPYIIKQIGL